MTDRSAGEMMQVGSLLLWATPVLLAAQTLPSMTDSAGVRIAEHRTVQDAPDWHLDPNWTVIAGGANDELFQVRGALSLSDGRIAVANSGFFDLRVYSADGELLVAVGREGQGPGEFEGYFDVFPWVGDSVAAFDPAPRRVTLFGPDGSFGRTIGWRLPDELRPGFPVGVLDDGTFVVPVEDRFRPRPAGDGLEEHPTRIILVGRQGEVVGTFPELPPRLFYRVTTDEGVAASLRTRVPLSAVPQVSAGGDRVWATTGPELQAFGFDPMLNLAEVVRTLDRPVPVEEAHRQTYRERYLSLGREAWLDHRRRTLEETPWSETVPLVDSLAVDRAGRLWVGAFRFDHREARSWVVFDTAARLVGSVSTPPGFEVLEFGDGYLLGLTRDEVGVETVVRALVRTTGSVQSDFR